MLSTKPSRLTRWAILDCNSFYCSCERLFRPELVGRPMAVLSNNDGCLISVSHEARVLGLRIGAPLHEVREVVRRHRVAVFSSNYQLYGELSRRVMRLLDELHPDVLQYSIDEAFIDFSHLPPGEEEAWAMHLCRRVQREIGVPVSVGVGASKTLAKVASRRAKQFGRATFVLLEEGVIEQVLRDTPVEAVWGVGHRSAVKLRSHGMRSAWDFRQHANTPLIRALLSVTGERLRDELRGLSCVEPGEMSEKKMISSTRSFGKRVYERRELEEAVATYVGFACEKLRAQDSVARGLSVMLRTNPYDDKSPYSRHDGQLFLPAYSSDTGSFTRAALELVRKLYRPGLAYKKAGVFLFDLSPRAGMQLDIFQEDNGAAAPLMQAIDQINQRWGRGTVRMAATGTRQDWRMLCEHRSDKTQLKWNDLLEVRRERATVSKVSTARL